MDEEKKTDGLTLKEEIQKLNQNFEEIAANSKVKKVKGKKLGKQKIKKGWVRYLYIGENGAMTATKYQINQGTIMHDGIPRSATSEDVILWDKEPTIIQPWWSITPLNLKKEMDESARLNSMTIGSKLILSLIEQGNIKQKKKISGAAIFGIVIAVIIIGYLLMKGLGGA